MLTLPPLKWTPSPNKSSRNGTKIDLVVVHDCEGLSAGSISWFAQARSQVSAHLVLREDGAEATQMVEFGNNAWHACAYNRRSIGLEMGGFEAKGFGSAQWQAAASIVAWLLHKYSIPIRWAEKGAGAGFCRHFDLGAPGGGHFDPTQDQGIWLSFADMVGKASAQQMPDTWPVAGNVIPPTAPPGFTPTNDPRNDEIEGSISWAQMRLNALGASRPLLVVDGIEGPATERAIVAFQGLKGLYKDGILGPNTIKALAA